MSKKKPSNAQGKVQYQRKLYIVLAGLLVLAVAGKVVGWPLYHWATKERVDTRITTTSKVPYIDGNDATFQVENFYRQYTNPNTLSKATMVTAYGNKNLEFYSQYYNHGFDPIVCSTVMPTRVTTTLESTGPTAHVNALAEYPDGSKQTISATVVIDDEGLQIDSVSCPGDKANLPPSKQ